MSKQKNNAINVVTDQTRIAYHEAGHAVVSLHLKLPFTAVSLRTLEIPMNTFKNGQIVNEIHIVTEGIIWPNERKEKASKDALAGLLDLREAVVSMAGPICEVMIVGTRDQKATLAAQGDLKGIMISCRAAMYPGKPSQEWESVKMEDDLINAVTTQAADLLTEKWDSVVAVATLLLEKEYLKYSEVVEIVYPKRGTD